MGFAQVSIPIDMLDAMAKGNEILSFDMDQAVPEDAELVTVRVVPTLSLLVQVYKHPNFKSEWREEVATLPRAGRLHIYGAMR